MTLNDLKGLQMSLCVSDKLGKWSHLKVIWKSFKDHLESFTTKLAILFNNFYASLHNTYKKIIGQYFGLYPKGRPYKMCESVQQKLGHTKVTIRQVNSLLGPFFQKKWDLSTFATSSLKVQKILVLIFWNFSTSGP